MGMTKEEAIAELNVLLSQTALTAPFIYGEYADAIHMAIDALRCSEKPNLQPTCNQLATTEGDLISRQAVLDALAGMCYTDVDEYRTAVKAVRKVPSVEPRECGVLCALAERTCPFQGKEYAWCLTCPHISEEDRVLVKKAVSEPKTGEWIFRPKDAIELMFTKPKCSECGFESADGGNYCPNCGAKMEE